MRFTADMDEPTHIIDPDGEVILVLKDANPPFAVWPEEEERNEDEKSKVPEASDRNSIQPSETEEEVEEEVEEEADEGCFRIKVSAKHLTLSSPVFKSLLMGGWKESSTFLDTGSTELIVSGWDLEAFLIVMWMIHSQHKKIPRKISLELFAKITVIADYYKCNDAIGFFSDVWLDNLDSNSELQDDLACTFSRDQMLWMWISWLFRRIERFTQSTAVAVKYSKIRISSLGLPLPVKLIDELNQQRERGIATVMTALQKQRSMLLSESWACSYAFQCTSMMLGGLENYMFANGLSPTPIAPFVGIGYQDLVNLVRTFEPPKWRELRGSDKHACPSSRQGYAQLKLTTDSIVGLNIYYYIF